MTYVYPNPRFESEPFMHNPDIDRSKTIAEHNGKIVFYAPCYCYDVECSGWISSVPTALLFDGGAPRNMLKWTRIEAKK